MAIFEFDKSHLIGKVREVNTRKITIHVGSNDDLRKARVGQLAALELPGGMEWLIGIIENVFKSKANPCADPAESQMDGDKSASATTPRQVEDVINTVRLTLVGSVKWLAAKQNYRFSRSINQVPEIDAECHILTKKPLENFMAVLSSSSDTSHALALGKYSMDEAATAYLDGDKFFQRHAALLGSTGSGKSWTVAAVLEQAAKLASANLIVLDLHGEYRNLSYARQLRIPGPEDLGSNSDELLYLPYWLLNTEEMQAMFIDRSEFSAHNQVMAFQDAVIEQKMATLECLDKKDVMAAFTLDSPIPFSIVDVLEKLRALNTQMVEGSRGMKQGDFYGQFSRLLVRLKSKLSDKRYGFLFQAPDNQHHYEAMSQLAAKLMDYAAPGAQIKVIDFSDVPTDILPVIVGLVARLIYQVQFWTDRDKRRPLALVCDEAHLYLPSKEGQNPVERRALEAFEKIAKEGRKYGVALLIVSQRPADVSPTILSQCNNVIALRLTNATDQGTVKRLMPESLESLLEMLPLLDVGEALVVGDAVLLPSRIHITPPKEQPLSATIDFWSEWQKSAEAPDFVRAVENMRKQSRK